MKYISISLYLLKLGSNLGHFLTPNLSPSSHDTQGREQGISICFSVVRPYIRVEDASIWKGSVQRI